MHPFLQWCGYLGGAFLALIFCNILRQALPRKRHEPPLVFHWVPFIGNAITYGANPYQFLVDCRKKHGDIFTFVLFGRKMTCYLGVTGNDFILNGKHSHLNAEDIYGPLTIPVFGSDVVYDCPNSKLMEQKKFMKFGLTQEALESYVPLIEHEVLDYIKGSPNLKGNSGTIDIIPAMAEVTIFTAGRTLQGKEVRGKLSREMAAMYHDLDMGFQPINFLLPWAPLPHNHRRDVAHAKMREIYTDLIAKRRKNGQGDEAEKDMIWNLMQCKYREGHPVPDKEIAHMMITMLMAGQHSSSSSSSWIFLRLAARPDIQEELYQEQLQNLEKDGNGQVKPLQYADLEKLPLLQATVKETLRMHSSITAILRKVTQPMPVPGTEYIVGTDKVLLAAPIVTSMSEDHFSDAMTFKPHRWLSRPDDDELETDIVDYGYGKTKAGTKSPYLPFGAGRHRCIGEKFAYVNLTAIVATMLRNFKLSTLDGSDTVPETDFRSLFSGPKRPAVIRWERRDGSASL